MASFDPGDLTVSQLLSSLKPNQLYGLGGAALAIAAGAFFAGAYLSNYKAEKAVADAALANERLAKANVSLEFFSKFLRYAITKKQTEEDGYLRFTEAHRVAKAEFIGLVKTWYADQNKVGAQFSLTPEVHKSYDPTHSNVVLPDQSQWPIPQEVKREVLGLKPLQQ